MNKIKVISIFLFFLFFSDSHSCAGIFDGSRPLKGSVDRIIEINTVTIKNDVSPDTIGLPKHFVIDFKDNVIRPSKDSIVRRIIKVIHIEHIENKLVLQGVDDGVENIDDGLAWSLVISKKTGNAILSASSDEVAYVVFGICTEIDNAN